MTPLAVISSSQIEADKIINRLKIVKTLRIGERVFYKGNIKKSPIVVCICGIGKANAASSTTLLIERFKPSLVYILGIGGAYPLSKLKVGDIVLATKEIYVDEGLHTQSGFKTMDVLNLPLAIINNKKFYNEFPMFIPKHLQDYKIKGIFATVSMCSGVLKNAKIIKKKFNAICENMEGAAIAHICLVYGLKAVEIRAISNIIEDRKLFSINKDDILLAAKNVQEFFLENLC